jgi:hypothetical protein
VDWSQPRLLERPDAHLCYYRLSHSCPIDAARQVNALLVEHFQAACGERA